MGHHDWTAGDPGEAEQDRSCEHAGDSIDGRLSCIDERQEAAEKAAGRDRRGEPVHRRDAPELLRYLGWIGYAGPDGIAADTTVVSIG